MKADVNTRIFLGKQGHIICGSTGDGIEGQTVLGILIWFGFFIFELVFMAVCYKFIYQKKSTTNKSLFDFIRSLTGYYIFIVRYKHHRSLKDQEMDAFLEKNGDFRHTLYQQGVLGMASVIIMPSVTVFLIGWYHAPGLAVLILLAAASVWMDMLKKSRIKIMTLLNEGYSSACLQ